MITVKMMETLKCHWGSELSDKKTEDVMVDTHSVINSTGMVPLPLTLAIIFLQT